MWILLLLNCFAEATDDFFYIVSDTIEKNIFAIIISELKVFQLTK